MKKRFWSQKDRLNWENDKVDVELFISWSKVNGERRFTVGVQNESGTSRIHNEPSLSSYGEAVDRARRWMKRHPLGQEELFLEDVSSRDSTIDGEIIDALEGKLKVQDMWSDQDELRIMSSGEEDGVFSMEIEWMSQDFSVPIMVHGERDRGLTQIDATVNDWQLSRQWDYELAFTESREYYTGEPSGENPDGSLD